MDNDTRDKLIIETHQDVKWLKERDIEHRQTHSKYFYYMVTVLIACILSWFK